VQVSLNNTSSLALLRLDESLPTGVLLVPRSLGLPLREPAPAEVRAVERVMA